MRVKNEDGGARKVWLSNTFLCHLSINTFPFSKFYFMEGHIKMMFIATYLIKFVIFTSSLFGNLIENF